MTREMSYTLRTCFRDSQGHFRVGLLLIIFHLIISFVGRRADCVWGTWGGLVEGLESAVQFATTTTTTTAIPVATLQHTLCLG